MNNYPKVYLLLLLFIFLSACQDSETDTNSWDACFSCTVDSWTGDFAGTCDYFDAATNSTVNDLPFNLTIEETASEYFTVYIIVPNYYSATISGEFSNPNYISFGGSSVSLSANLYSKESQFRLTGSSKKYHMKVDSLVIDQVLNFESLKQVE